MSEITDYWQPRCRELQEKLRICIKQFENAIPKESIRIELNKMKEYHSNQRDVNAELLRKDSPCIQVVVTYHEHAIETINELWNRLGL